MFRSRYIQVVCRSEVFPIRPVTRFWIIKLLRTALTLWFVVTFTFVVLRTSGDPVVALLGADAMPDEVEQFRSEWGLDQPLVVQYLRYIGQMMTGQFGQSLREHRPVMDVILERVPATLVLGLAAYLLAALVGIPAGILAALRRGRFIDRAIMAFAVFGFALPNFFLGILLILLFSLVLQVLPSSGMGTFWHLIMPAVTLGTFTAGTLARFTRSAMLEVLDPEQNATFVDHYLEVEYDLSNVMFVTTANSYNMPGPLLDRMEIISLSGYTEDEKVNIATRYLAPKQIEANGLKKGELEFQEAAIRDIIRYYTREAGVRSLERQLAKVCRKVVKEHAAEKRFHVTVDADSLEHFLGVRKFRYGLAEQQDQVGQVTGLAWTQVGGELLTIEAAVVPGKGRLTKTGSLGEVMGESITAALTVVRSRAVSLGIAADFHEKQDIHIHVPEGATPKDGPSAGIGMCTALVSALTQIPVRADVAMTGEITLRGQVLAIGGLKEKLLAAHRGGIKTVIIPEENQRDLKEIPENIKQDLQIKPVKWIDEVLQIALQYAPEPLPDAAPEIVAKDDKREPDSKERISTH